MAYTMGDVSGGGSDPWDDMVAAPLAGMKKVKAEMSKIGKDLGKAMAPHVSKSADSMKKAFKDKDKVKGMTSMFSMIGGMTLGPINVIISLLEKLGVAGPIMDVLDGLMSIFSGTLMEELMPAFEELFDVLLGEDTIELVKTLAKIFGAFLVPLISAFSEVLKIMIPIWSNLAKIFAGPLATILPIIARALMVLVLLGFMPLITGIYLIGAAIAAVIQMFSLLTGVGGTAIADWNDMMLPSLISMTMAIPQIMGMQHGGYVPATLGGQLIRAGEGGEGEHVIPESQMKEVIWATEDNGKRLDRIYTVLVNSGRLM